MTGQVFLEVLGLSLLVGLVITIAVAWHDWRLGK